VRARRSETTAQSSAQIDKLEGTSLKAEVKEALLNVLRSKDASAASKASAGRTLLEYFSEAESISHKRRGVELTASELDDAIALLEK